MGSQKHLIQRWIPSRLSHHNKNTRVSADSSLQSLVVMEHVLKYAQHVIQMGYVDVIYLQRYHNIILHHHAL